jgi:hypothetical protein
MTIMIKKDNIQGNLGSLRLLRYYVTTLLRTYTIFRKTLYLETYHKIAHPRENQLC